MADRGVNVRIGADVSGYVAGMRKVATSTRDLAGQVKSSTGKIADNLNSNKAAYNDIANASLKAGALATGAVVAVTKSAMGWESAWAGVTKTVNGSNKELSQLEGELRGMAKTMPQSHADIAAVAEAAGQLGVKTKDISSFTKVMLQLGDTTNLTSDEAATSLAQFMNVMGTAGEDVGRLGATIVALGNNGASTERDIVQMGQRIAGAGKQVGLSEQDVLAYSNALASVGIEAEAGGTAISQSFLKIDQAVRKGGEQLDVLAQTAGVSSAEFRRAWQIDAAGALNMFLQGLGQVQQSGGDTTAILDELGMTGIRQSDALRRLASSGDLLTESLDQSKEAWKDNTALAVEAAKRYETAESQMKIAWNGIQDAAIDAGQSMLPVVKQMADGVASVAAGFGDLPPSMQGFITKGAAVAGVGALAAGGLLKAATSAAGLVESLRTIRDVSPGAVSAMGKAGKAAAVLAAALAAVQITGKIAGSIEGEFTPSLVDASRMLAQMADNTDASRDSLNKFFAEAKHGNFDNFGDAIDAMDRWDYKAQDWIRNLAGMQSDVDVFNEKMGSLDDSLVSMVQNGNMELAQQGFAELAAQAKESGVAVEELVPYFDDYQKTLKDQADALGVYNLTAKDYADWMGGKVPAAVQKQIDAIEQSNTATEQQKIAAADAAGAISDMGDSAEDSQEQIDDLADSLFDLSSRAMDGEKAAIAYQEAIDDVTASVKENGRSHDISTKKGRENQESLLDLAEASQKYVQEQVRQGKSTDDVIKKTRQAREDFIRAAEQMGYSRKEAGKLADEYGLIPSEVKTKITTPGMDKAQKDVDDLIKKVKNADGTTATIKYRMDVGGTMISERTSGGVKATSAAGGGLMEGPGTKTSDSILARLSRGEYVEQAAAVDYYGQGFMAALNQRRIPKESLPAFASGGPVEQSIIVQVPEYGQQLAGYLSRAATRADKIAQEHAEKLLGGNVVWPTNTRNLSGNYAGHSGVDIAASMGAPIFAATSGAITYTGWGRGYGQAIFQQLTSGQEAVYGHTSQIGVSKGELVSGGQTIGKVGSTGKSTGPHLHFEIAYAGFGTASNREKTLAFLAGVGAGGGMGSAAVSGGAQAQIRAMMSQFWGADQWPALKQLVQNESGWNPNATNPSSGAYGLFQALPASKIDAYGPRGTVSAQGMFGMTYIRDRYGTPIAALQAWQARSPHWYWTGGPVSGPGGPTDDKVPAWLSNGEYVVNAKSSRLFEPLLDWMNAQGHAAGGPVSSPSFGSSALFNTAAIVALIRRLENPIADLASATKSVRTAATANAAAQRALAQPKAAAGRATSAYTRAVQERNDLRATNARQINVARANVAAQENRVTAASLALKRLQPSGAAASKAQTALVTAQNARDRVAASNAEKIAKLNDQIAKAKKGSLTYANLIEKRDLQQKANARALAVENGKVATAKKAAEKAGVNTAKVQAAQNKLAREQAKLDKLKDSRDKVSRDNALEMAQANKKVTDAAAAKKKAQDAYDLALDKAKARSDAYKQAQEALAQAQQQVADQARQTSEAFAGLYSGLEAGQSVYDLISSMRTGTLDLSRFTSQIERLRKAGLAETVIEQIMSVAQSQGAAAGSALATQINSQSTIKQLNSAASSLQAAADVLGYKDATATKRAGGGPVIGAGGPTDDKVRLLASNGEYVQSAESVKYYGLAAMRNLNDRVIPRNYLSGGRPVTAVTTAGAGNSADVAAAVRAGISGMTMRARIENGDWVKVQFDQYATDVFDQAGRAR